MPCTCCCEDLDIRLEHLVFPERMSSEGRAFVAAHGLSCVPLGELVAGALDLGDGVVKIRHRCQQLRPDGLCGVYEQRPAICREFNCATRTDCSNLRPVVDEATDGADGGSGRVIMAVSPHPPYPPHPPHPSEDEMIVMARSFDGES
jgi:Fe-S-cluster containining protein